ncbi:MAG: hypothetical protein HQK73_09240, partial [Desulfamplus sp.]|nr:hypothetical protein [Desulfamplus sp.]
MFELIYTSYPRGLQSGTSGFTPVAYTEGIPKTYIQLCESLSGYTFVYPIGHPLYDHNPEIYTHYRFKVLEDYEPKNSVDYKLQVNREDYHYGLKETEEEISILSRVAVSGRDYSGRENKIAHHVILDNIERLKCVQGPAWLMINGNIFVEHWDQTPSLLQPKTIDLFNKADFGGIDDTLHLPKQWQSIFSDANPALMLAQSVEYNLKKSSLEIPSFILFNSEYENLSYNKLCLTLVGEALNLVPPNIRWNITFNSYFIAKPMDSDCLWRCCPTQNRLSNITNSQINPLNQSVSLIEKYTDSLLEKYPDSIVINLNSKTVHGKIPLNKEGKKAKSADKPLDSSDNSNSSDSSNNSNFSSSGSDLLSSNIVSDSNDLPYSSDLYSSENYHSDRTAITGIIKMRLWVFLSIFTAIGVAFLYILFSHYLPHSKNDLSKDKQSVRISSETQANDSKAVQTDSKIKQVALQFKADAQNKPDISTKSDAQSKSVEVKIKKKLVLRFYDNIDNVFGEIISDNFDLKNIKCRLIRNDGTEIDSDIEPPITNDTPNWDIIPAGIKEPAGSISTESISLYDKVQYAAIYLDLLPNNYRYLIWTGGINITPSMLSKGTELNTIEIRFDSEMSALLPELLSIISSEGLTGVVEIQSRKIDDIPDNKLADNSNQTGNNSIFYPICSIKNDKIGNIQLPFIELKFTDDDFKSILNNITSNSNLLDEQQIENSNFFKELKFKEFRIDYTDKQ